MKSGFKFISELVAKIINTFFPRLSIVVQPSRGQGIKIFHGDKAARARSKIWTTDSHYAPNMYIDIDGLANLLLNEAASTFDKDDRILDICCNVGRHINYLTVNGFKNVHGFDIMKPAIDQMNAQFPSIDTSKIKHGDCIDILPSYGANSFDWAYTHTATIELIHPSFDLYNHLKRILVKGFIFLLDENGHTYPRFYTFLSRKSSFKLYKRIVLSDSMSLCVWIKENYFKEFIQKSLSCNSNNVS